MSLTSYRLYSVYSVFREACRKISQHPLLFLLEMESNEVSVQNTGNSGPVDAGASSMQMDAKAKNHGFGFF